MRTCMIMVACLLASALWLAPAAAAGDPQRGEEAFRVCRACHSVVPDRHMTGPSLADIWGRKAGTVEGFGRYSEALGEAEVVWDEDSLDAWLTNPRAFIPGNSMIFRGIADAGQRADIIAYLEEVSRSAGPAEAARPGGRGGGMRGGGEPAELRSLGPNNRIVSITYCKDTYAVATQTEETHQFWEFNLRFKTDGSAMGPPPGQPVLIPAGMMGDRAFVIFAAPQEISAFIKPGC